MVVLLNIGGNFSLKRTKVYILKAGLSCMSLRNGFMRTVAGRVTHQSYTSGRNCVDKGLCVMRRELGSPVL